jgi:hypothetical protein
MKKAVIRFRRSEPIEIELDFFVKEVKRPFARSPDPRIRTQ